MEMTEARGLRRHRGEAGHDLADAVAHRHREPGDAVEEFLVVPRIGAAKTCPASLRQAFFRAISGRGRRPRSEKASARRRRGPMMSACVEPLVQGEEVEEI